jgi:AcrR family transcriptional regulator
MARWEPGARGRLQAAALDLYVERGFEQTTAAEIAESVGLTERTFFRYFADKREVLFDGQDRLVQQLLDGVATAPAGASALEVVVTALTGAAASFPDEHREHSRRRQTVIAAHPALLERELLKMAGLAAALAGALRQRGVPEPAATLAAQSGATVFGVSFGQWITDGEQRSLADIEREVVRELLSLGETSGVGVERPTSRPTYG